MDGMNTAQQQVSSVLKRVLLLYGAYTLLFNTAYLVGYYFLPEGLMRSSPQAAAGRLAGSAASFEMELVLTLVFNLGWVVGLALLLNLNQVNGMPTGYIYPPILGVVSGLVAGTNSFTASNLTQYNVRDGMALNLSIGSLEMLGYICIIAATVKLGIYQYRSWWRWQGEWKAVQTGRVRDVRLDWSEAAVAVLGLVLILCAAYRETLMAWNYL